jgi:phenylacetate-CoA ligase
MNATLTPIETEAKAREQYWIKSLNTHLEYIREKSPYYKKALSHLPQGNFFRDGLSALKDLPFTVKDDLARHNWDFLAVPKSDIIDYATTSGTLGDPVAMFVSENDLQRLAKNEKNSLQLAGCTSTDVFQLMTTIDKQFMAGLAYHYGTRALGAGMVRTGPGVPAMQWKSIQQFKPSVLIAVPSFIPFLLDFAEKHGIDANSTSVKKIVCIGEALTTGDLQPGALMKRIKSRWNVELISTYASTEMATAFTACSEHSGVHVQPELIVVEVLDENGNQVKNGEQGEVVVTPLGVEATPLLRYRTGDICHYYDEPCACGRTTPRLGPVLGRQQQMIKLKGTTLYPNMIVDALNEVEELKAYIIQIESNEWGGDELLIRCAASATLEKIILDTLRARLRVTPKVSFESAEEIRALRFANDSRKPVLVRDLRS